MPRRPASRVGSSRRHARVPPSSSSMRTNWLVSMLRSSPGGVTVTLSATATRGNDRMQQRHGMSVPFGGMPLHAQREWFEELVDLGYTDIWSAETDGADGLTPLALASVWTPTLRLGTAILPAYTRGPALLAQSVGSMAQAAP